MKTKYEVVKTEVQDRGLAVLIHAKQVGTMWGIWAVVPWSAIDRHALYDAVAREERRQYEAQRWDQGQDHPLF